MATDRHLGRVSVVAGASIYPSVQNLLLAARAMGLGASLITLPHKPSKLPFTRPGQFAGRIGMEFDPFLSILSPMWTGGKAKCNAPRRA